MYEMTISRYLYLDDGELTLENCIKICRTSDLTQKQLKVLSKEEAAVAYILSQGEGVEGMGEDHHITLQNPR